MISRLEKKQIRRVHDKYGSNNSRLGRAAGVSASIVLTLLIMKHGEYSFEGLNTPEERKAAMEAADYILREKLTPKQKILFDFIAGEIYDRPQSA